MAKIYEIDELNDNMHYTGSRDKYRKNIYNINFQQW